MIAARLLRAFLNSPLRGRTRLTSYLAHRVPSHAPNTSSAIERLFARMQASSVRPAPALRLSLRPHHCGRLLSARPAVSLAAGMVRLAYLVLVSGSHSHSHSGLVHWTCHAGCSLGRLQPRLHTHLLPCRHLAVPHTHLLRLEHPRKVCRPCLCLGARIVVRSGVSQVRLALAAWARNLGRDATHLDSVHSEFDLTRHG